MIVIIENFSFSEHNATLSLRGSKTKFDKAIRGKIRKRICREKPESKYLMQYKWKLWGNTHR